MAQADIGIIGLGVMGQMLALNMERNGFRVAGFDLDAEKVARFAGHTDKNVVGCGTIEAFIEVLEKPRRIMMMVPAGRPVDAVIADIKDLLEPEDQLIDGGNSHFKDTERRGEMLAETGIHYIGTGVSGGEHGALWGPSIMPGGQRAAWERVQPVLEAIAAKVGDDPCVAYMGPRGAGHYVKMVHNGIEYGDMQLIAEVYDVLHRGAGVSVDKLHAAFTEWNDAELSSYLVEITRDILAEVDEETGEPLVDLILDEAKQKGTGKWTSQDALDVGAPTPTINAAVEARIVSAYRDERQAASKVLSGPEPVFSGDVDDIIQTARDALYAAKICSYAQGFGSAPRCRRRVRLRPRLPHHRQDLAWRLHHPRRAARGHPGGLRQEPGPAQPADGRGLRRRRGFTPGCAARLRHASPSPTASLRRPSPPRWLTSMPIAVPACPPI